MTLRLKSRSLIPHGGGFRWRDPITNVEVFGTNYEMLIQLAYNERRANSAPIGLGFEQEVEADLCRSYPDEAETFDPRVPSNRRLGLSDVVHGTMAMIHHRLAGSPLVSQEEANRRAEICARCAFNVTFTKPCSLCPDLENLVRAAMTSGKSTPFDNELKSCQLCSCFTKVSVWTELEIQCKPLTDDQRDMFKSLVELGRCWKNCS